MEITYRLADTQDPEERLEDAAMWKALHDEYGDKIALTEDLPTFGRTKRSEPVADVPYWTDPAFLSRANREIVLCTLEAAADATAAIHALDEDVFIKSTRLKHFTKRFPRTETFAETMGAMAYSFCDRGQCLLVQEFVRMEYEHRFVVINRKVVAHSPIAWHLTPIHHLRDGEVYRTPRTRKPVFEPSVWQSLTALAREAARELRTPDIIIDCAVIDGTPGIVELNPLRIGQFGLYACDVKAVAAASRDIAA